MCDLTDLESKINQLSSYFAIDTIINNTQAVAWWVKDLDNKFLRCNQATCNLFYGGCSPDDIKGLSDVEYTKKVLPESDVSDCYKNSCHLSDNFLLNSDSNQCHFLEHVMTLDNKQYWMYVTKEVIPPNATSFAEVKGTYGTAVVLPDFVAQVLIDNTPDIIKLSDNSYVVKVGPQYDRCQSIDARNS